MRLDDNFDDYNKKAVSISNGANDIRGNDNENDNNKISMLSYQLQFLMTERVSHMYLIAKEMIQGRDFKPFLNAISTNNEEISQVLDGYKMGPVHNALNAQVRIFGQLSGQGPLLQQQVDRLRNTGFVMRC